MPETTPVPPTERDTPAQPGSRRPVWRRVARAAAWSAAGVTGLVAGAVILAWQTTPGAEDARAAAYAAATRIVSSDGETLDEVADAHREPLRAEDIPTLLRDALLATEDRRFFDHHGLDPKRLCKAVVATLGGDVQGASTLTQQLARNLFPQDVGRERSLVRKLREMVVAVKLEQAFDKPELLALYANHVSYLHRTAGLGAASRLYFDKPVSQLQVHEAALLVAMLKGPAMYDPERYPERALARRNLVIDSMVADGRLDRRSAQQAKAHGLDLDLRERDTDPLAPHYLRRVRQALAGWAEAQGVDLERAGLTVEVGLDSRLQALAEQAVARQGDWLQGLAAAEWSERTLRPGPRPAVARSQGFRYFWDSQPALSTELLKETPTYQRAVARGLGEAQALDAAQRDPGLAERRADMTRLQAGFIALDPKDGRVLAYVGSRGFDEDRYDHVGQARRQPGSTFKPFVYGAALQAGMRPEQLYMDTNVTYHRVGEKDWTPTDLGGPTGTWQTMRTGLAQSRNTITAQVMNDVGISRVMAFAQALGVASPLDPVPSLALGTSPVTLLEMAQAYGSLAALGTRRNPVFISRILDRDGRVLYAAEAGTQRVMEPDNAAQLVDMMRDVVDRGTGTALRRDFRVKGDVAGKTGTTQRNTDGWFMAIHPTLVTGAWVGFNDQRVTMRSTQFGQGGRSALRIVGDVMAGWQQAGHLPASERFPFVPRPPVVLPMDDVDEAGDTGGAEQTDLLQLPAPTEPHDPPAQARRQNPNTLVIMAAAGAGLMRTSQIYAPQEDVRLLEAPEPVER